MSLLPTDTCRLVSGRSLSATFPPGRLVRCQEIRFELPNHVGHVVDGLELSSIIQGFRSIRRNIRGVCHQELSRHRNKYVLNIGQGPKELHSRGGRKARLLERSYGVEIEYDALPRDERVKFLLCSTRERVA